MMKFTLVFFTVSLALAVRMCDSNRDFVGVGQSFASRHRKLSTPEECARHCGENEEPKTCYYHFTVEYFATLTRACDLCHFNTTTRLSPDCQCITADGYETSGIITANRMYPGPAMMVCVNDYVVIDAVNAVPGNGITLHWHGLLQNESQYYDGVPYVTQCPISEGATFRYQWRAHNPGTHFWHSHSALQKGDGLTGAVVIRQPKSTEPNSDLWDYDLLDNVIIINDLFHGTGIDHFPGTRFNKPGQHPDNFLINGLGQWTDPTTGKTTTTPLANITVKAGHRYRFRMINSCSLSCTVELTIQGHNLTVIAADGTPIKPVFATSITSSSAERFDFVLHADKKPAQYWIQLRALGVCAHKKLQQLAVLSYESTSKLPEFPKPSYDDVVEKGIIFNPLNVRCDDSSSDKKFVCVSQLESAVPPPEEIIKEKPDVQIYWPFGFYKYSLEDVFEPGTYNKFLATPSIVTGLLGNISNTYPPSPYLSQRENVPEDTICSTDSLPSNCQHKGPCVCLHLQKIPLNSLVEIMLVDEAQITGLSHPFHLHGHVFYVIGEGRGVDHNITSVDLEKTKELDKLGLIKRNLQRPPAKDTYAVPNNGYSVIRFYANNPGYWLFHCHFSYHLAVGMSVTFQVGEQSDFPPVPEGFPTCKNYIPPINDGS